MELDYQISAASPERQGNIDLGNADDRALHYDLFLGDISARIGHAGVSTGWGLAPVLDFAVGIVRVLESLSPNASEDFEFTESEAALHFERTEADVIVSADYVEGVEGTVTIGYEELLSCARNFRFRAITELQSAHPSLAGNPVFATLRHARKRCMPVSR